MDRKVLGAVIAALTLALAGCGGSSTLSRADYVKQVNAICKRRATVIAAAMRSHRHDFRAGAREALPGYKKSLDELASLKGPADLRTKMSELIAIEREQLSRIEAAMAGRRATGSEAEETEAVHKQAALRVQLGLRGC